MKSEIEKKYVKYEELKERYIYLKEELSSILKQIAELEVVTRILNSIKNHEENKEELINIGGGIFAKVKFLDKRNFLVNVGNNVYIEKDVDSILSILNEQIKELNETLKEVEADINSVTEELKKVKAELKHLIEIEEGRKS